MSDFSELKNNLAISRAAAKKFASEAAVALVNVKIADGLGGRAKGKSVGVWKNIFETCRVHALKYEEKSEKYQYELDVIDDEVNAVSFPDDYAIPKSDVVRK